jgi:SRSO17 transposase
MAMTMDEIKRIGPELTAFVRQFADCFGRREPLEHARTYICGQLSDLPRKSVEPIADQAGIDPRALQKFLAQHKWDCQSMVKRMYQMTSRDHAHPLAVGIIDETSFPKKGTKTPGVQRQHCGASGKQDNCVITVHLGYATPGFHCLLSSALFLPESWSGDRERCREAGIPDELVHRTKWRIALELHREATEHGVHLEWLTADEHYGRPVEFHLELSRRNQKYVVEVPANFWCWCRKPQVVEGRRGLRRKDLPTISNVADLTAHSKQFASQDWQRFRIKDGTKGPIVWEVKAAPIYLKGEDDLPTGEHWLIVARNSLNPEELKYFVSNASQSTSLAAILHVAFSRWHVERCFEDEKTELGMDHFEVRTYDAMMRHLTLTAASYLFVARVHQKLKKNAGVDGVPGSHGSEWILDIAGPERPEPAKVLGENRANPGVDAAAQREGRAQSSQGDAQATAKSRDICFEVAAM